MTDKEKLDAIDLLYKNYFGFLYSDDMRLDFQEKLAAILGFDPYDDDAVDAWKHREPAWKPTKMNCSICVGTGKVYQFLNDSNEATEVVCPVCIERDE